MPNYRRAYVPAGCWFFTVNLLDRRNSLLVDEVNALRLAFQKAHARYPFLIDAVVIPPDHIHAVWTLPPGDADFSVRWRLIKSHFVGSLPKDEPLSNVRRARSERGSWQRRFWEHLIRNETDYARHVEYCYINPVKHGLVTKVSEWPHSSFHRDVRAGIFPADWAGKIDDLGEFGER